MLKELKDFVLIPPHGEWSLLLDAKALAMTCLELTDQLSKKALIVTTPMIG